MFSFIKFLSAVSLASFLFSCNLKGKRSYDIHIRVITGNKSGIGNTFPPQITSLLTNIYSDKNGGLFLKPRVTIERYDSLELGVIELKNTNFNSINYSVFTPYSNVDNRAKLEQFLFMNRNDTILVYNIKGKENLQISGKLYQSINYYENLVFVLINKIVADNQEIILLYNIQIEKEIKDNYTAEPIKSEVKMEKGIKVVENPKPKKSKPIMPEKVPSSKNEEYHLNTTPGQ